MVPPILGKPHISGMEKTGQTPKGIQKLDPLEDYRELYRNYIGVIMALYRGSNF